MNEIYDETMTCEILISDGEYTIGYVDGQAAQWYGNARRLQPGDAFAYSHDGSYFGVQYRDEYRVDTDRKWEKTPLMIVLLGSE